MSKLFLHLEKVFMLFLCSAAAVAAALFVDLKFALVEKKKKKKQQNYLLDIVK